ncbi:MAG: hypothetical protein LBC92_03375 [Rickettsiales bacterium]|nr:hypothetical protein [Rickettsiales bacterium]
MYLHKHLGNNVKKGETLYTIHTNSETELKVVLDFIKSNDDIIEIV